MMLARMSRCRPRSILLNWGRCAARGRTMSSVAENEEGKGDPAAVRQQLESAAREDRLDFMTAAKILFSTPAKPKKFGLDFHLWQFFAACLPPFAVYLTAQYARYEIRRLEKEKEQTERLLLQTVDAEELASRLLNEGEKTASDKVSPSSTKAPEKEGLKPRSNDAVVQVFEEDLQAMKKRLEALERKLSTLQAVSEGVEANTSQSSSEIKPRGTSPRISSTKDELQLQKKIHGNVSGGESDREQQRTTLS